MNIFGLAGPTPNYMKLKETAIRLKNSDSDTERIYLFIICFEGYGRCVSKLLLFIVFFFYFNQFDFSFFFVHDRNPLNKVLSEFLDVHLRKLDENIPQTSLVTVITDDQIVTCKDWKKEEYDHTLNLAIENDIFIFRPIQIGNGYSGNSVLNWLKEQN